MNFENITTAGEADDKTVLDAMTHPDVKVLDDGAVLALYDDDTTTMAVNIRRDEEMVTQYVDRRSGFGNPFTLTEDGGEWGRHESVDLYRGWLLGSIESEGGPITEEMVEGLRGETLGCWCLPKNCHTVVLMNHLARTAEDDG